MKIIIVGGVAAGASAAARLRRLDETAEIILVERGPYISYANCGLPYHVGNVIPERQSLLVMPAAGFAKRFRVDVRTECEAVSFDPAAKTVTLRAEGGSMVVETYDKLLLATGSTPVKMELPGLDPARVMQFWTIPDMDRVIGAINGGAKRAVVVGAGFIGLEIAENLRARGLDVAIVELAGQVLPTVDAEMSSYLAQELLNEGITLKLGRKITGFDDAGGYGALLDDGERVPADLVILCVGVKPNSELARAAGVKLGARGHIAVDETLRTSAPDVYAAGDVIEVVDGVTGKPAAIPLAGPANKQGRIAADNMAGRHSVYGGTLGASVIKVGKLTVAGVGLTERRIQALGMAYRKIYTHPGSRASYYPGGALLHMKLLFAPDGRILGAQAVGAAGADKRIDVIATAMRCGKTAPELAELELSYAPPYNSAKDPVNFLGMIAGNMIDMLSEPVYADALPDGVPLDVREAEEFATGSVPGAVNIPLGELRSRLGELDRSRRYIPFCRVGMRGYVAERILKQNGFAANNLSGGFLTWQAFHVPPHPVAPLAVPPAAKSVAVPGGEPGRTLDVRALACPGPVVRLKKEVDAMREGESLKILALEGFAPDLANWLASAGHELAAMTQKDGEFEATIRKAGKAREESGGGTAPAKNNDAAIILFSNDLDKALAALIVACGMAAAGSKVTIFFTFWGLSVLRRNPAPVLKKSWIGRMFGMMLPKGARKLKLSKMNMGGVGSEMMRQVMARENVPTLEELLRQARELGVKFIACEMAMNVMGLRREELIEVDEVAGVASFAAVARQAGSSLFI